MTEKDILIDELKKCIIRDSAYLTQTDQNIILLKIDELDKFINLQYEQRKNNNTI